MVKSQYGSMHLYTKRKKIRAKTVVEMIRFLINVIYHVQFLQISINIIFFFHKQWISGHGTWSFILNNEESIEQSYRKSRKALQAQRRLYLEWT